MRKKNAKRNSLVKGKKQSIKVEVLTPAEFLINQLVGWFVLGDNAYTASGWRHYDTVIKAGTKESKPFKLPEEPGIYGMEDSVKKNIKQTKEEPDIRGEEVPGKLKNVDPGQTIGINGHEVTIYRPLLVQTIKRNYFDKRDWNVHELRSLTHQRFLNAMYTLVSKNFEYFLCTLSYAKGNIALSDKEYLQGGLACLPELIDQLNTQITPKHRGIGIPDLYTYEEDNLYMSHDLKDIKNIYRGNAQKQLYAYTFSRDTASQFSALLSELFVSKHEELTKKYYGAKRESIPKASWHKGSDMPNATRSMMKQVDKLFELKSIDVKDEKRAKFIAIEVGLQLLFFEKLRDSKELTCKLEKYHWVIAQAIMTRQSASYLYGRLPHGASKDLKKTFNMKSLNHVDLDRIDTEYKRFRERIIAALDLIRTDIQSINPDEIV